MTVRTSNKSNTSVGPTPGPLRDTPILAVANQPTVSVTNQTLTDVHQAQRDTYDVTGTSTTVCIKPHFFGLSKKENEMYGNHSRPYNDSFYMQCAYSDPFCFSVAI